MTLTPFVRVVFVVDVRGNVHPSLVKCQFFFPGRRKKCRQQSVRAADGFSHDPAPCNPVGEGVKYDPYAWDRPDSDSEITFCQVREEQQNFGVYECII